MGSYTAGSLPRVIYTTDDGTSGGANGFLPRFLMIKSADVGSTSWVIVDSSRGTDKWMYANESATEATVSGAITFNSNGFTLGNQGSYINASGTYIYLAIA